MKTCSDCGKTLPLDNFSPHGTSKDGFSNLCRKCKYNTYLPWRKKNVRSRPGYLYIFKTDGDMYKIGITKQPETRHQAVSAHSPIPVEIAYCSYFEDASIVENEVHNICKEFHSHFEWFRLPVDALDRVLDFLKDRRSDAKKV